MKSGIAMNFLVVGLNNPGTKSVDSLYTKDPNTNIPNPNKRLCLRRLNIT